MEYIFQSINRSHDVCTTSGTFTFRNHFYKTSDMAKANTVREVMKRNPHEIFEITPQVFKEEIKANAGDKTAEAKLEPLRRKTGRPKLQTGVPMNVGMRTSPTGEEQ